MALDAKWWEFAKQAARGIDADEASDSGLTVTFRIAGVVHGAMHVASRGASGPAALAQALIDTAREFELGPALVTWQSRTRGPWTGERSGACVLDLELESLPEGLKPMHIEQTLESAQQLTERSVLAIGEQLHRVYELARSQVTGLEQFTAQFSSNSRAEEGNVATTIDTLTGQVRSFGQQVLDRTQRQARDIEQARLWTNDIVKLGQAIAAIASNARVLTFNARLESARIGEAGRGFAVIAGSIQELATQIRQTNDAVARLAENLAVTLPRLGVEALETSEAARQSVQVLEAQLREVNEHLAGAREQSWQALNDSTTQANELKSRANSVLEHLQFQDRTSQMLQQAREQTRQVLEVAGLDEPRVDEHIVAQVGVLGRSIESERASRPAGSFELF